MRELKRYIKKAMNMPPKLFIRKSIGFVCRRIDDRITRYVDFHRSTYAPEGIAINPVIYKNLDNAYLPKNYPLAADFNIKHYFDLLGSGWVQNNQEDTSSTDYRLIDWHKDFKSGYRYSANTWYKDIKSGLIPGVDIKVPWESSRMQHLVLFAYAYREETGSIKEEFKQEFCNEIIDFIEHNPPRFGVCWRCTMDVGIRIANWLMAYDLFVSFGAVFDEEFSRVFARSVYDHAKHIVNNLEYTPELTSNHYLSDIGGLLFASVHLESTAETDAWLAFSLQELVSEMRREFHEDGSNFEASVSYHCLSTEIMLHCACLCQHITTERRQALRNYQHKLVRKGPGLRPLCEQEFSLDNARIFPNWFWERLHRALYFVEVCSDDGLIQQIGDVDSGRFLKLMPVFVTITGKELKQQYVNLRNSTMDDDKVYLDENLQNHEHLLVCMRRLSGTDVLNNIETAILATSGISFVSQHIQQKFIGEHDISKSHNALKKNIPEGYTTQQYVFPVAVDSKSNLTVECFHGIGIYSYRTNNFHMLVRCGEVGQNGNGGHSHNDQLSLTLTLDGKQVIADPGSYLYTPDPVMRNKFRGTAMHFTPQPMSGIEQNEWEDGQRGLFSIKKDRANAQVLYVGCDGIIMRHNGFGTPVWRVVEICSDGIVVTDYGVNLKRWKNPGVFSNGYGKLLKL